MVLEILTPDRNVYSGNITSITLPGQTGSFQILKDHAPLIATLVPGLVVINTVNEGKKTFNLRSGVVEVADNKVTVLAEKLADEENSIVK